jgi:type I restriction-modification system DNA methylase subunit
MADQNKERERDELHRAIWAIANDLRGSIDGWDFKAYVLGMMFYRYISSRNTLTSNNKARASRTSITSTSAMMPPSSLGTLSFKPKASLLSPQNCSAMFMQRPLRTRI